jgi:N-acetylglucosaminyldiphosphoundecaprenol N-acetyl-beta-D-mannosaminyltransferase
MGFHMSEKINIRGVCFDSVTMNEAVEICNGFLDEGKVHVIHTPNAEIVQLCAEQNEYYDLINSADLVIPDGAGVILASKILGCPLQKGKVAGIELCERLIKLSAECKKSVFFLGGKPGIAEEAAVKMKERYPSLLVAGCSDGYFKDDAAVIKKINDSGASVLLICLGVPRQEKWMYSHRNELNIRLMGGFGGSFDIFSGVTRRAPRIFIRLNLEWLYRLICEPRRIRRMMKLPKFIIGTILSKK